MAGKVKPIPDGFHTVTVGIAVNDAARAIDFYKRAFGAQELYRMEGSAHDPTGETRAEWQPFDFEHIVGFGSHRPLPHRFRQAILRAETPSSSAAASIRARPSCAAAPAIRPCSQSSGRRTVTLVPSPRRL